MGTLPLEGIRVLGMTAVLAGPFAELFLADYGAEVIRVESLQHFAPSTRGQYVWPPKGAEGYPNHETGARPWNRNAGFNSKARNKLSMTVDITRPEGMDIFLRLVKESDVFLANYVPTVMDRLGINYNVLKKVKPDIIYALSSGYGNTGPYRTYRALAHGIDGISGQTSIQGYRDTGPEEVPGSSTADALTSIATVFAIVAALNYRDRTGKGQLIDLCLYENFITSFPQPFLDFTMNGRLQGPMGNRDPLAVPSGNFRCVGKDNWVSISVFNEEQWEGFCQVVDEEWVHDSRFKDPLSRRQHEDDLEKLVESWTSEHDYYEVMHLLQKVGVPAGPVLDEPALLQDPHLKDRGFFVEESQEETGTYLNPGFVTKMRNAPLSVRRGPVRLGEDNEYIYKQVLKVSDAEYDRLVEAGHIGMDFAPGMR